MDVNSISHQDDTTDNRKMNGEKNKKRSVKSELSSETNIQTKRKMNKAKKLRSVENILPSTSANDQSCSHGISSEIILPSSSTTYSSCNHATRSENIDPNTNEPEKDAFYRVRKSKSKKFQGLPLEKAECLRVRVNQNERKRHRELNEAFNDLRKLDIPFNAKLAEEHKVETKIYAVKNATEYIRRLMAVLNDADRNFDGNHNMPYISYVNQSSNVSTVGAAVVGNQFHTSCNVEVGHVGNHFTSSGTGRMGSVGFQLPSSVNVGMRYIGNQRPGSSTAGLGSVKTAKMESVDNNPTRSVKVGRGNQGLRSSTFRLESIGNHFHASQNIEMVPVRIPLPRSATFGLESVGNQYPRSVNVGMGYIGNQRLDSSTAGLRSVGNQFHALQNYEMVPVEIPFSRSATVGSESVGYQIPNSVNLGMASIEIYRPRSSTDALGSIGNLLSNSSNIGLGSVDQYQGNSRLNYPLKNLTNQHHRSQYSKQSCHNFRSSSVNQISQEKIPGLMLPQSSARETPLSSTLLPRQDLSSKNFTHVLQEDITPSAEKSRTKVSRTTSNAMLAFPPFSPIHQAQTFPMTSCQGLSDASSVSLSHRYTSTPVSGHQFRPLPQSQNSRADFFPRSNCPSQLNVATNQSHAQPSYSDRFLTNPQNISISSNQHLNDSGFLDKHNSNRSRGISHDSINSRSSSDSNQVLSSDFSCYFSNNSSQDNSQQSSQGITQVVHQTASQYNIQDSAVSHNSTDSNPAFSNYYHQASISTASNLSYSGNFSNNSSQDNSQQSSKGITQGVHQTASQHNIQDSAVSHNSTDSNPAFSNYYRQASISTASNLSYSVNFSNNSSQDNSQQSSKGITQGVHQTASQHNIQDSAVSHNSTDSNPAFSNYYRQASISTASNLSYSVNFSNNSSQDNSQQSSKGITQGVHQTASQYNIQDSAVSHNSTDSNPAFSNYYHQASISTASNLSYSVNFSNNSSQDNSQQSSQGITQVVHQTASQHNIQDSAVSHNSTDSNPAFSSYYHQASSSTASNLSYSGHVSGSGTDNMWSGIGNNNMWSFHNNNDWNGHYTNGTNGHYDNNWSGQ